jgi:hypothetical protein
LDSNTLKYLQPEREPNRSGQVFFEDLHELVYDGNIREHMTTIMNMAQAKQHVLWSVMFNQMRLPPFIDPKIVEKRHDRFYKMTGIYDIREIQNIIKESVAETLPDNLMQFVCDGPALIAKLTTFPVLPDEIVRKPRDPSTAGRFQLRVRDAYPEISHREQRFESTRYPIDFLDPYALLPLQTGQMCWETNPKSFYVKLAKRYNQHMMAGPSGTTDMTCQVLEMLTDFDPRLAILACIGWMGMRNDHSVFEICLAGLPFGLKYNSKVDAILFAHNLLDEVEMEYSS